MLTIITPTFNSAKTIRRNAVSVVNQIYLNFNHIIIDNLSSDETVNEVKSVYENSGYMGKLKIICEKDSGISAAFNKGIKLADGDIIVILNSDDYFYDNNVLKRIIDVFKDEKLLFVHGNIYFEDPLYGSNIRKPLLCPITTAMPYNHPTMFFRKEVYEQYGSFDTDYNFAMDYEFICRLYKSITDFNSRGYYLDGKPLVTMVAGGASWRNELKSIEESRKALMKYGYWNFDAKKNYIFRKLRTKIKSGLSSIGLERVVTSWRKRKWENL
jgi:glycosyltransferase involved in cell wall biosynthesis